MLTFTYVYRHARVYIFKMSRCYIVSISAYLPLSGFYLGSVKQFKSDQFQGSNHILYKKA